MKILRVTDKEIARGLGKQAKKRDEEDLESCKPKRMDKTSRGGIQFCKVN